MTLFGEIICAILELVIAINSKFNNSDDDKNLSDKYNIWSQGASNNNSRNNTYAHIFRTTPPNWIILFCNRDCQDEV